MTATLVVGPAGSGKTWLLRKMAQTAHELGDQVFVLAGSPAAWPEWDVNPDPADVLATDLHPATDGDGSASGCVLVLDEAFRPEVIAAYDRLRTALAGHGEAGIPHRVFMSAYACADPLPVTPDDIITLPF